MNKDASLDYLSENTRSASSLSTISDNSENAIVHNNNGSKGKRKYMKGGSDEDDDFINWKNVLHKIWSTRQTQEIDKENNPELYVKITLRELGTYIGFLLILCIITFGMTSPSMFYFTNTLQSSFTGGKTELEPYLGFTDVVNMDDVWRYLEDPFQSALYTSWYIDNSTAESVNGYVLNENRLLGLPRLRQVKVRNNSCVVHSDFKEEIKFCYDSYAPAVEDKDPFGKYYTKNATNETPWYYQSEKDLKGSTIQGMVNSYEGGGFVALLTNNSEDSGKIIQDLKENLWITRGTRGVFIDFTLYNANLNLFCQVRLTFEFPATGGVIPSSMFRTSKLIRYVNNFDYFIMACEVFFIIYIVYYTIEELLELYHQGKGLYASAWNLIDLIIILVAYVCIAFNIYRNNKVNDLLDSLLVDEQQYPDFEFLGYWQMQFNNVIAGATFISWMKIFKYTSFNKTMTQLTETISRCAKDVAGFAVMFFIIFLAYAQLGYLIFGTQVYDFSTFAQSIYTLFRIILGDFDYEAIQRAQRVLGPIYFLSYIFFVFFVLLNMFLAIINDTYAEVKGEIVESEIKLTTFLKKGCNRILEKCNLKRDKIIDIQHALAKGDLNGDKLVDFDEFRNNLKTKGYADLEIETLFAKYDLDGDRILNKKEQKAMFADLSAQDEDLRKAMKDLESASADAEAKEAELIKKKQALLDGVSKDDYNQLSTRIETMETSLGGILEKLDSVLSKINQVEKAKTSNTSDRAQSASSRPRTARPTTVSDINIPEEELNASINDER